MANRKGKRVDFYLDDETYNDMMLLCQIHSITKTDFLRKAVKQLVRVNTNSIINRQIEQEIRNELGIRH